MSGGGSTSPGAGTHEAPRSASAALRDLQRILPPGSLLTEPIDLIPYSFDGTAALQSRPLAVVLAESTGDVASVIRWARDNATPVSTRGSGTGLAGGSVPSAGGLVLCLSRLNRILEVDRPNLCLLAEAGVTTQQIAQTAEAAGLFYPPDPGSMKISTIGGNVANNSGGLRGLKYGVTRDYVMGLEVVLPDGDTVWLGSKCVKDVAGLSLKDLFIGSEGILGVITKVLLKLVPRPASKGSVLATFGSLAEAAEAVSRIIARPVIPCTLEFLDKVTIRAVEDYARVGLPLDAEAVLFMESDGHPAQVREECESMKSIALECGATGVREAHSPAEALDLATARRTAFSALARIRPTTILEDVTVPRDRLAALVTRISAIAAAHKVLVGIFGHFGDGNVHPTFLTDERDAAEMERVHRAIEETIRATLDLGGTITGEHGVGLAKKSFLPMQLGASEMRLLASVKSALDPAGLLNPGKILDLP